jgi:transposase
LSRAARRYDTPEAADSGRFLSRVIETATAQAASDPAALVADGIAEFDEARLHEAARDLRRAAAEIGPAALLADGLAGVEAHRWTEAGLARRARPRRAGRPKLTREFLARVADWAREARDYNAGTVYAYVAKRAGEHLGHDVQDETVKGWIRRCKSEGLLLPGELRHPRKPRAAAREDR